MSADILALLSPQTPDTWPQGILAAAEDLEGLARLADYLDTQSGFALLRTGGLQDVNRLLGRMSPDYMRAAAHHWRGVAERHRKSVPRPMFPQDEFNPLCDHDGEDWPCSDIVETADEARTYAGGPA